MTTPVIEYRARVMQFTGRVTFAATVNDVDVEVKAKIFEDFIDWDAAEVWWCDVDVLPVLHYKTLMILEQHFDENRDTIIQFDQE